jgi:antitoxin MazE6
MKIAVSIPDDIFEKAEKLARKAGKSRSEVFTEALREYFVRHATDDTNDAFNRVADVVGGEDDQFVRAAGKHLLEKVEW